MAGKQEYNQLCPIASALDVLGSRWALLVVRELALGPRRFKDIHAGLETASTDMLTSRLRELEATCVVERCDDRRYQLTANGWALGPMIRAMFIWSLRTGAIDGVGADGSPRSFGPHPLRRLVGVLGVIARTTPIDADDAEPVGEIRLEVGDLTTGIAGAPVGYRITDEVPAEPAGTITIAPEALFAMLVGGAPAEPLVDAGQIDVDTPAAQQVLRHLAAAVAAVRAEIDQPLS